MTELPRTVELTIEVTDGKVGVFRSGSAEPIIVQNAQEDKRPFLHPIAVPGGSGSVTEEAPAHHPWQHGLYIGLNDVNGVGFWTEGMFPKNIDIDGTFHPEITGTARAEGNTAAWMVGTQYRSPKGDTLIRETQAWRVTDLGDRYELDLEWTLHAEQTLHFGAYDYGGPFLRMPFRDETGGAVFNSSGQHGTATAGQRARWVAVQMPVPGHSGEVLVALMDHPANLEHPVPWRVDKQLGVNPSVSIAGDWTIPQGRDRVFGYRVIVYARPVDAAVIEEAWELFSRHSETGEHA